MNTPGKNLTILLSAENCHKVSKINSNHEWRPKENTSVIIMIKFYEKDAKSLVNLADSQTCHSIANILGYFLKETKILLE